METERKNQKENICLQDKITPLFKNSNRVKKYLRILTVASKPSRQRMEKLALFPRFLKVTLFSFFQKEDRLFIFSIFNFRKFMSKKVLTPPLSIKWSSPYYDLFYKKTVFWLILVEHFKILCQNDLLQYMTSKTVEVQVITVKILWHYVRQILSRIFVIFGLTFTCTY